MAIYHLSAKIISRSSGRSAVGASAYRAGEKLINEHDGMTHNYTKKSGIVHSEIMLCKSAPAEYKDRQTLWNEVEKIEKSSNAQLAREIEIALPTELEKIEQIKLIQDYVKENFVKVGMCADITVHDKGDGNPHAHIMLTMRSIDEQGKWESKSKKVYQLDDNGEKIYNTKNRQYKCKKENTTDWNEQTKLEEWRESWAKKLNQELEKKYILDKVDHRSFERQGIHKIPTVHLGTTANQLEKRGMETERGNYNRGVKNYNEEIEQINQALENIVIEKQMLQNNAEQVKETPKEIAKKLYSREKEVYKFIEDMQTIRMEIHSLQQEKIQIPFVIEKLKEERGNLQITHQKIKNIDKQVMELKRSATIFKNNKSEIESKTRQLKNLKSSFNQAIKAFRSEWNIEPNKGLVQAKIQEYEERFEALSVEATRLQDAEEIQSQIRSAVLEYKTEKLLAELQPNGKEITSELAELKRADQNRAKQSISISLNYNLSYISDKDKQEIAERIKEIEPEIAINILQQLQKSFGNPRHQPEL